MDAPEFMTKMSFENLIIKNFLHIFSKKKKKCFLVISYLSKSYPATARREKRSQEPKKQLTQ